MLTLIFVDSEIETIPQEMWNDPAVIQLSRNRRKSPGEILLDSSLLHRSIERYFPGSSKRRGRPDVFHILFNVLNSSILNITGNLRFYVHTRNDFLMRINPITRMPKSYNRFAGLIEQLFQTGEIDAGGQWLMKLEKMPAMDVISSLSEGSITVMWPSGEMVRRENLVTERNQTFIIGGFTSGDYISDISNLGRRVSIFPEELTIWTVASEIISSCENFLGL